MAENDQAVEQLRQDDDAVREKIREKIQAHGGDPQEITLEPHGEDAVVAKVRYADSDVTEQGVFLRSNLFPS